MFLKQLYSQGKYDMVAKTSEAMSAVLSRYG